MCFTARRTVFTRCALFTWGTRFAGCAFTRFLLVANFGLATLVLRMLDGGFVAGFAAVVGCGCVTFFTWATFGTLATAFAAVTAVAVT